MLQNAGLDATTKDLEYSKAHVKPTEKGSHKNKTAIVGSG